MKRPRAAFLPLALGALLASGCRCEGPSGEPTEARPSTAVDRPEPGERPQLPTIHPPVPAGPVATVARVVEDPEREGPPTSVSAGQLLSSGDAIVSGGATVVVDFNDGGRVELYPGGRAVVGGEAPAQIFIGAGSARGALAAAGNSTRPPLRIGTPAGTVEIPGSGDVVVALLPDGSTWAAALAGAASVARGEKAENELPLEHVLPAGRAIRVSEAPLEAEASPSGLEAIRAHASEIHGQAAPLDEAGRSAAVTAARAEVDELVESIGALLRDGQALRADRSRPDPANPNWRRDVLIRSVRHSLQLRRDRRLALTRYERWRAACVAAGVEADAEVRGRIRVLMALPEAL